MTLRHVNSVLHEGNNQFKGNGLVKWCALCGVHRPIQGGFTQWVLGGRHFCCAKHPNPKDTKCKPAPRATKTATKVVPVPQEILSLLDIQKPSLNETTHSTNGSTKTPTPKPKMTKKMKEDIAQTALEVVKASMMALAAPLVVAPANSAENTTPTISTNQKSRR